MTKWLRRDPEGNLARYGISAIAALTLSLVASVGQAQPRSFRDCSDCPEMIPIPPGSFVMGASRAEEAREGLPRSDRGRSVPTHRVAVPSFAIGVYDVTRAEFAAFVRETGHRTASSCWTYGFNRAAKEWVFRKRAGRDWRNPGFPQTDRDPVVCVSWNDASAYVAWLARKTGKSYRLPSEAEWEYVARAGSSGPRFWDDNAQACRDANVSDLTFVAALKLPRDPGRSFKCRDGYVYTAPVGSFEPNAFGLYDMLGNVGQWIADCWNKDYRGAPAHGRAWLRGDCTRRISRGGSWEDYPNNVRAGYRDRDLAAFREADNGFRVARSD